MSASLVGSEMCIRDSPDGPNGPLRGSEPAEILSPQGASSARIFVVGAVSYTHLTLPTICSV
eukprot:8300121-Alexandrium_andersonii.AAC.1